MREYRIARDESGWLFRARIVPARPSLLRRNPRWTVDIDQTHEHGRNGTWEDAADWDQSRRRYRSIDKAERAAQGRLDSLHYTPPGERPGIPVGRDPWRAAMSELDALDPHDSTLP